ncbi:hypothetical protein NPX13_g2331 [Xylaria arbuscula]|uniref:Heterokaryon incompatibility domain-containing protein n=1 Tax=Xylaria arbuscula TaxID=114810 RepID=A0A9W8NJD6_9PEZI|nr:hypothetical protein NPX13_g2331 [Xylaria arbuscula]
MRSKHDILKLHERLISSASTVRKLVDKLYMRDSRFQIIQESISELQLFEGGNGALCNFMELLKHYEEYYTPHEVPKPLEEIWQKSEVTTWALIDIIFAAIYEIMDVFAVDIAADQIPTLPRIEDHVQLLKDVYSLSTTRPVLCISSSQSGGQSGKSHEANTYQYTNTLAELSKQTGSKKIRVLHLLPGSGHSRIACRLEVQDLRHGIDEALSYVWGKYQELKCIWVNDQPFQITGNLYEILVTLRRPSTTRTLWIDAICINQSDFGEKSHQVSLMGDIYSNARTVTIWLGGRSPDVNPAPGPYDPVAPLPSKFGRKDVDQYDIVSIITWIDQLLKSNSFERDHFVAWAFLLHWVNVVMSHEWWERVWTIQEAVLPKNHPKVILGAYEFSFGDILLAINKMKHLEEIQPRKTPAYFDTSLGPLHPGHDDAEFPLLANPIWRNLEGLINATSHYKATDPRDKYFALQGLMCDSRGKLMYTNYNESTEAVFRRATAQCYNGSPRMDITTTFDLFVETPQATGSNASIPSWVIDFTYSDTHHHTSRHGDEVTFRGYIRDEVNWNPRYNLAVGIRRCFATPKTLFCSGISIDTILTMGLIPDLGDSTYPDELMNFVRSVAFQNGSYWIKEIVRRYYRSGRYGGDLEVIRRQHGTTSASTGSGHADPTEQRHHKFDGSAERIARDLNFPAPDIGNLFLLGGTRSLDNNLFSDRKTNSRDGQIRRRLREVAGKQFFTTENGLAGISTAPVEEGDTLAVMDGSPAYYIFREVKASNGRSYLAQRHRIVARAVVSEDKDNMKKRLAKLQSKLFQIV